MIKKIAREVKCFVIISAFTLYVNLNSTFTFYVFALMFAPLTYQADMQKMLRFKKGIGATLLNLAHVGKLRNVLRFRRPKHIGWKWCYQHFAGKRKKTLL